MLEAVRAVLPNVVLRRGKSGVTEKYCLSLEFDNEIIFMGVVLSTRK